MDHKAKKSLGQNFLSSEGALWSMRKAGSVEMNDVVLEIGPGKGALTKVLLEHAQKIIAVEKDHELVVHLEERFKQEIESGKLVLIEKDILLFDPLTLAQYKKHDYKIIANIPYNITGAILEKFLSTEFQPKTLVLLVQNEVAKRIVARDKKESILSISVKAYGTPVYIQKVLRGSFYPIPNVDSAILAIEDISRKNFEDETIEGLFFKIVKTGFSHKRKKLIGNLKEYMPHIQWGDVFNDLSIDTNVRAEDIELATWIRISKHIKDINI